MNKKKQKTVLIFGQWPFHNLAKRSKSFLVLFFKKELLVFVHFSPLSDGLGVTFFVHKKEDSSLPSLLPLNAGMKLSIPLAFLLSAGFAQARVDPTPKPSGIVVHLFGPQSALPEAHMSVPSILKQMFVTGDPSAKPGSALPKGRAAKPGAN